MYDMDADPVPAIPDMTAAIGIPREERAELIATLEGRLNEELEPLERARYLTTLGHLSLIEDTQDAYRRATDAYESAYGLRRRAQGKDHPETIDALLDLARCRFRQTRYADAESMARHAEATLAPPPAEPVRRGRIFALLGEVAQELGRYSDAEAALRQSIALLEEIPEAGYALAGSYREFGTVLYDTDRIAEAESYYRRALALAETTLGSDHPGTATYYYHLANLLTEAGDPDEATALSERALSLRERAFGPTHIAIALSLNNIACMESRAGNKARVEALFRQAIEIVTASFATGTRSEEAVYRTNLASTMSWKDQPDAAMEEICTALAIQEAIHGKAHPSTGWVLNILARICQSREEIASVESYYLRAIDAYEASLGPYSSRLVIPLHNLASLYKLRQRYDAADSLQRWALLIVERQPTSKRFEPMNVFYSAVQVKVAQQALAEAETLLERADAVRRQRGEAPDAEFALTLCHIGNAYVLQNSYSRADTLLRRSLKMSEEIKGTEAIETGKIALCVGLLRIQEKRYEDAILYAEWGLGAEEIASGLESPELIPYLNALVNSHLALNAPEQAEPFLRRIITLVENAHGVAHPKTVARYRQLASVLDQLGRTDEAARTRVMERAVRDAIELSKPIE